MVAIRNAKLRQCTAAVTWWSQIVIWHLNKDSQKWLLPFTRWLSQYPKINNRPPQAYHAFEREPSVGYLSRGHEFQAFWYEMACQIKTGQNIYIELCTLHGNHNSYAEIRSINACFPQLSVCAISTRSHSWGSLLLTWFKTDIDRNTKITASAFLFVYRLYIGLVIPSKVEEHEAAASQIFHIPKSKTLHCVVVSRSCTKFCFVEKNKR